MTVLPPTGYAAGVPRPAIGFSIDVPDHWTVLDLDPDTWDGWLDAFLETRAGGAGARGEARAALVDLLGRLHQEKVFMAAILAADVGGELVSASATLAWRRVPPIEGGGIPVEGLRRIYPEGEIVALDAGDAVRLQSEETMELPTVPGAHPVSVTQYLMPVLDTEWLAVITATTGNPALAPGVTEVADSMAASLTFQPAPDG